MVKLLVENCHNIDLDARTPDWSTPCHLAAKAGNEEILRYLIDHNANFVLKDKMYEWC